MEKIIGTQPNSLSATEFSLGIYSYLTEICQHGTNLHLNNFPRKLAV